jgi:paraquat-inducible protein B
MMTWPTEKLREIANKTAEKLNEQRAELRALLAKVKADLETADRALGRAATFVPIIDGKPQCPDCHIKSGRSLDRARAIFDSEVKRRPRIKLTIRQGSRVMRKWPDENVRWPDRW